MGGQVEDLLPPGFSRALDGPALSGQCGNRVSNAYRVKAASRKVRLMIKPAPGVFAVSFAIAMGTTIVVAPAAFAGTYCGQASSGAKVYAGNSDTSCEFAMSTAEAYWNHGIGS